MKYQKKWLGKTSAVTAKIDMYFLTVSPNQFGQKKVVLARHAIEGTVLDDTCLKIVRNRVLAAIGRPTKEKGDESADSKAKKVELATWKKIAGHLLR